MVCACAINFATILNTEIRFIEFNSLKLLSKKFIRQHKPEGKYSLKCPISESEWENLQLNHT